MASHNYFLKMSQRLYGRCREQNYVLNFTIFDGVLLVVCFGSNFSWYSEPCGQGWNYYCIVYCLGLDCILQVWYLSGSSGLGLTGRLPFYPNPGQSWIRDAQRLFNLSPPTFYIEGGGLNSSYLIQHCFVVFQASWFVTAGIRGVIYKEDKCKFQEIADFFNCCSRICWRGGNPL